MAGPDDFSVGGDQEQDTGSSSQFDPAALGGLSAVSQQPDLLTAIALSDRHNFSGGPPNPQSAPGLLDIFRGIYMGYMPGADAMKKAQAQWQQASQQAVDPRMKYLQAASGLLQPTRTGSFGESLGYGVKGLAQGLGEENKMRAQLAQQNMANQMGLAHFGLEGAKLDATLQALNQRMMKPSPEAIKASSRADLTGKPRNSPEWQTAYTDEMNKGKFLANISPDLKSHIFASGNPDQMTLADMQRLVQGRQAKLDKQKEDEFGVKTNPLFQYGVSDPSIFDNLEGDDLKNALASHPQLASAVNGLVGGNITEAQLRAGRSSSGTVPYLTNLALRVDPDYSTARNKLMNDYKSSKEGSTGAKINAINTAIGHVGTLSSLGELLKNHDFQGANAVLNSVLSAFGKPPVNDYKLAQQAVSEELMRVFRQAGASEREASAWGERFSSSNSPEKIQDAARTAVELLRSRMDPLNETWKREFHKDFPILTEKSQGVVSKLQAGVKNTPIMNAKGWKLHTDKNGNKAYVSPDGKDFEEVK